MAAWTPVPYVPHGRAAAVAVTSVALLFGGSPARAETPPKAPPASASTSAAKPAPSLPKAQAKPPARRPARQYVPLLDRALQGPMRGVDEIVFAVRVPGRDHWYVNFGYYCENAEKKGYGEGGQLCRFNLRAKQLTVLLDDPRGGVRDPQVHYDGRKILFAYRPGGTEYYHLHEIGIDGKGLARLTDGPFDDYEPAYLPDGGIVFISSRAMRWVNCWHTQVGILYRCDGDGSNLRPLSANIEHDNTPWVLPDGRILYMRWEYVDRSRVKFHHLWSMYPDGTNQMVYYGNQFNGTVMLDAKPIPGTDKVVSSFSPGHGQPEHVGRVTIVDPKKGPDDVQMAKALHPDLFRDPYPFSEDCFLVADHTRILLLNGGGELDLLYELPATPDAAGRPKAPRLEVHEPVPLAPRPREFVLPARANPRQPVGHIVLADILRGRNMAGVKPGEITKLLVLETLPKPVNFSGTMEPISKNGTFTLPRILGTIPVEPDGSAYAEMPALRSLFFVALDANDLSVKRMQSFFTVQPGETVGCVGCHENRTETMEKGISLSALRKPPARIESIRDIPDVFDFPRDIQPLLDKHCVSCHNPKKADGKVILTNELKGWFSESYHTLIDRKLVTHGLDALGNKSPRAIGTSSSRLMQLIDGSHQQAAFSPLERKRVMYWIESGVPYAGTYASLGMKANRFDAAGGFKPNANYVREMKRFGVLPKDFDVVKDRIDCYETDQAYWKLFWWPPGK